MLAAFRIRSSQNLIFKNGGPDLKEQKPCCFCTKFRSLIFLAQLIGIFPLVLAHDPASSACLLKFRIRSFPNIAGWFGLCVHCYFLYNSQIGLRNHFQKFFKGTDLYVFSCQAMMMQLEVFVILVFARLRRQSLEAGFNKLREAWNELQVLAPPGNPRRGKYWCWILTGAILGNYLVYSVAFLGGLFGGCFQEERPAICNLWSFLKKVSHSMVPLYQLSVTGLFCALCLLIQSMHYELGRVLEYSLLDHERLDLLRRIHGKVCRATSLVSDHFGITVLCIACTALVTCTSGFYLLILNSEGLIEDVRHIELSRYWLLYFALLSTLLILVPAQLATNSISSVVDRLSEASLVDLDPKAQFQVSVFAQKVKGRSGNITACNITSIGLGFCCTAVTNCITYILILLQFRLATPPPAEVLN